MKKHLIIFFLLITAGANAQEHDIGIFYKISGNGIEKPSYIFGTVHLICQDDAKLKPNVKSKILEVDKVVFEIDLSDPKNLQAGMDTDMPGDTTLDMLLSKEKYTYVARYLKDTFGLDSSKYNSYKPVLLLQFMAPYLLGCDDATAMEVNVLITAMFAGKKVDGLESADDQMDALDALPLKEQASEVYDMLKEYEQGENPMADLVNAYISRDIVALANMMKEEDSMTPEAEKALLEDRNRAWIPKIETLIKKKACFFAVGAGHLSGETGVLNLLRAAGYTVTPLDEY